MGQINKADLAKFKVSELVALLDEGIITSNKLHATSPRGLVTELIVDNLDSDDLPKSKTAKAKEAVSKAVEVEDEGVSELFKLAQQVKREKEKAQPKKATQKKYVSKFNNFLLKPTGLDKNGLYMRYSKGYNTLSIEEQNKLAPNGVAVDFIKFEGDDNLDARYYLKEFGDAHGLLIVPARDATLQKFIESHEHYGKKFVEYNEKDITRRAVQQREEMDKVGAMIATSTRNDLLIPLIEIYTLNGMNGYRALKDKDLFELKQIAYDFVDEDVNGFMEASSSYYARYMFLGILAIEQNFLKLTNDEKEIKWANGQLFTVVQIGETYAESLGDMLSSPENVKIAQKLEALTGFALASHR